MPHHVQDNTARDARIIVLAVSGVEVKALAIRFEVSTESIRKILKAGGVASSKGAQADRGPWLQSDRDKKKMLKRTAKR